MLGKNLGQESCPDRPVYFTLKIGSVLRALRCRDVTTLQSIHGTKYIFVATGALYMARKRVCWNRKASWQSGTWGRLPREERHVDRVTHAEQLHKRSVTRVLLDWVLEMMLAQTCRFDDVQFHQAHAPQILK